LRGLKGLWWEPEEYLGWPALLAEAGYNFLMLCYTFAPATGLRWRQPFEASEERVVRQLAEECAARGIELGLAIHPSIAGHAWAPKRAALSIHPTVGTAWFREYWQARRPGEPLTWDLPLRYGDDEDLEVLVEKLVLAARWGVRAFALCLDDIEPEGGLGRFPSLAGAQASLLRGIRAVMEPIGARLLFVPTYYWTAGAREHSEYTAELAGALPADVDLFWTGEEVRSHAITAAQAREASRLFGRRPLVWLNYASNDSFRFALQLPPDRPPAPDLGDEVAGLMVNSTRQSRLARLDALVLGEYLADPAGFDLESATARAAGRLVGPEATPEVLRYFTAWEAYPDPRTLPRDLVAGGRPLVERLIDRLSESERVIGEVLPALERSLADRGLYAELAAGAARLALLVRALSLYRLALERGRSGTGEQRAALEAELRLVDGETACDAQAALLAMDRLPA
jgi:hypothetical protein